MSATANQSTLEENPGFWSVRLTQVWHILCSLRLLVSLLAVLVSVVLLRLLIPQQLEQIPGINPETSWAISLPFWLRPLSGALFELGFANIFQSVWFWVPAGLLLLHSLVALAAYGWPSWRRLREPKPLIEWQHPLALRLEQSTRLPDTPDEFLEACRQRLRQVGFATYLNDDEDEQRLIGGTRHRWSWLGVIAWYAGIILILVAGLISHFQLEWDRQILSSLNPTPTTLLDKLVSLQGIDSGSNRFWMTYTPLAADQSPQTLTLRRYWPTFFGGMLVWPADSRSLVTIQVKDTSGRRLGLTSPQGEQLVTEQLMVPIDGTDSSILFSIPETGLAFSLSPSGAASDRYNVQVLRGEEATQVEDTDILAGESLSVENLSLSLTLNYELDVVARRDPALPLYPIGLLISVIGALLAFLRPPVQVWLIPEIKGRGGQIYAVLEQQFGTPSKMEGFLRRVLEMEAETDK